MHRISSKKRITLGIVEKLVKILFFYRLMRGKKKQTTEVLSNTIRKILFIEIWGIGDLVIASPALEAVKNQWPSVEITLLSKSYASDVFKYAKTVDQFVFYDFPWTRYKQKYRLLSWDWLGLMRLIKKLRREGFDLAIDARGDFRNNVLSFLIGAKRRLGYDWSGGGCFLTDVATFDYKNNHRIKAWLNLLKYLDIRVDDSIPFIPLAREEEEWAKNFLMDKKIHKDNLLIGIHPAARIKTRCWPLDRFARVADYVRDKYKAKIIVFIDPDGYGKDIPIKGEFVFAQLNLRQLVAVLRELDLFICNDGGAMHLAAAVHTPVVALFGPTESKWFGPTGEGHTILMKEDFSCRPCFDYCHMKNPICLDEITTVYVQQVLDKKLIDLKSHV